MAKARGRNPGTAPRLTVQITERQWNTAIRSDSGGCLIADAIKTQFPDLSAVTVDMATIRATDRARGERYTWLTPGPAQNLLLGFDQGWNQATEQIVLRDAVKIDRQKAASVKSVRDRAARKDQLEAKEAQGELLTGGERSALKQMRATDEMRPEPLPTSSGPVTDVISRRDGSATVVGGRPLPKPTPETHPNLLAGRDRHFGAKLSQPGVAFQEALEKAVAERLAADPDGGATQTAGSAAT
jgi:hypothetical protein